MPRQCCGMMERCLATRERVDGPWGGEVETTSVEGGTGWSRGKAVSSRAVASTGKSLLCVGEGGGKEWRGKRGVHSIGHLAEGGGGWNGVGSVDSGGYHAVEQDIGVVLQDDREETGAYRRGGWSMGLGTQDGFGVGGGLGDVE